MRFDQIPNLDARQQKTHSSMQAAVCFAFGVGGVVLVVMLIKGTPWIAEHVYPWLTVVASLALMIILPISLLMAVFQKSRGWAGLIMVLSSYIIGVSLWVWSLIVAYVLAGTFWMIVGILVGGIGVVPIAFVASIIHGEWNPVIQIGIGVLITFGLRGLGTFLVDRPPVPGRLLKDMEETGKDETERNDLWLEGLAAYKDAIRMCASKPIKDQEAVGFFDNAIECG